MLSLTQMGVFFITKIDISCITFTYNCSILIAKTNIILNGK